MLRQRDLMKSLEVGSLLYITRGYSNDWPSKGKILAIDEVNGQKVYSIQIKSADEPVLSETKEGKKIDVSSIGHLPITEQTLKTWKFEITGKEEVRSEELEGYKIWKESGSSGW